MAIQSAPMTAGSQPSIHGRRLGLNSTGALVGQDGHPFEHASGQMVSQTTADTIPNWGQSILSSTAVSTVFTLAAPVIGAKKRLVFNASLSTTTKLVSPSSNVTFSSTTGSNSLTFTSSLGCAAQSIDLVGTSSAGWRIAAGFGTTTLAIST